MRRSSPPFAALTGYEEAVKEAARLTDSRPEPDEDKINELNTKLSFLKTILSDRPEITVNYFIPDGKSQGDAWRTLREISV